MAKSVANVVIATDSFATLVGITNQLATAISNEVLTANSSADGANTTGNSFVIGTFSANTIAVPTALRGGFVNAAANLNISSNVVFNGATNFVNANTVANSAAHTIKATTTTLEGGALAITSNTTFGANATFNGNKLVLNSNSTVSGTNSYVNSATFTVESNTVILGGNTLTIAANTITITGNTTFSVGYPTYSDVANFSNSVIIGFDLTMRLASNSDIGSNTTSPQTVLAIPKADFKSAKISAQVVNGANVQLSEILLVKDGSNNAYITVFGTVTAPNTANLGVFSVSTTASDVNLDFLQTQASSSVKLAVNQMV